MEKPKPIFTDMVIGTNGDWEIILRSDPGMCGWLNFWVDRKSERDPDDLYESGISHRHLISFNVDTRRVDGAVGWQNLDRRFPKIAKWFLDTVSRQFPYCAACHEEWKRRGCGDGI